MLFPPKNVLWIPYHSVSTKMSKNIIPVYKHTGGEALPVSVNIYASSNFPQLQTLCRITLYTDL